MLDVVDIQVSDLASRAPTKASKNSQLDEASRELVGSVFYGTLLKTMRQSELKGKYGHGGRGEEAFAAQLDAQFAKAAGKATKGGLADAVYKYYVKQQTLIEQGRQQDAVELPR